MTDDLVARLRASETLEYTDHVRLCDEAADEIERLRAELAMLNSLRSQATKECDRMTAERDELRELLREAREWLPPASKVVRQSELGELKAHIDAALKEPQP